MYGAGAAWSRLFLPGARADPSRSEPESAPGPWPPGARAGAAQKSGGSATLIYHLFTLRLPTTFVQRVPIQVPGASEVIESTDVQADGDHLSPESGNLTLYTQVRSNH